MVGDAEAVFVPVQALFEALFVAVQDVALVLDQVNVLVPPGLTVDGLADIDTDGSEGADVGGVDVVDVVVPPLQAASANNPPRITS